MSYPHYDLVQRAYQELVDGGFIKELQPGHQEEVEEQKGLLTRRAAYYSFLKDAQYGILEKTTGNNSKGYSVDIIISVTGLIYDVASDNGRIAFPINGGPSNQPDLIPRWRQPTAELAGIGIEPPPDPDPNPLPPDDDDIKELLAYIIEQNNLILARQDNLDAQVANTRLEIRAVREKQNQPYSYSNRFIGGITPVGVD